MAQINAQCIKFTSKNKEKNSMYTRTQVLIMWVTLTAEWTQRNFSLYNTYLLTAQSKS